MHETECLLIGQDKRNQIEDDIQSSRDQIIYPTDYQLLRIINLAMILSGTLFEMLKVYSPEQAQLTQADYSNVDEEEIIDQNSDFSDGDGQRNNLKNRKRNKKKKSQKKTERKKTK